jgi:hypothetical protein
MDFGGSSSNLLDYEGQQKRFHTLRRDREMQRVPSYSSFGSESLLETHTDQSVPAHHSSRGADSFAAGFDNEPLYMEEEPPG